MPVMLKIIALLFLAQASFALIIINNWPPPLIHPPIHPPIHPHSFRIQGEQIHPNFNPNKCLDVQADVLQNGTPVQIYDCNGTPAQRWLIHPGGTAVQLAGTRFCLDAGASPANGVPLKIWQCYDNLPAQEWFYTNDHRISLKGQGFCADLENGDLTNGNVVQVWKCTDGDVNQIWTTSPTLKPPPLFGAPPFQQLLG